jgi:hypothetical protein
MLEKRPTTRKRGDRRAAVKPPRQEKSLFQGFLFLLQPSKNLPIIAHPTKEASMQFRKRGKILRIKTGYNPNSSSVGANLTPLILIGSFLAIVIPAVSFYVSYKLRDLTGKDGDGEGKKSEPPS